MKLETLYPELGNLYGDSANLRYLRQCLPDAAYVETHLGAEPAFVRDEDVAFLYLGPMTERGQLLALEALRPYAGALDERLQAGMHALFTGNAMELPGQCIVTGNGSVTGLGLVELTAEQDLAHRYNSLFLGDADGIRVTGFNSRFSSCRPGASVQPFAQVQRGQGLNRDCPFEGYRYHNLLGTYLLGPLLVLNPLLTERLLKSLGCQTQPVFFEEAMAAYQARLSEFEDRKRKLD